MEAPNRHPSGVDLHQHAVRFLTRASPGMSTDEALEVVDVMRPVHLLADTLLFEEGDTEANDYMVLVLDGHLRAVGSTGAPGREIVISVVGPGSLLGEMGVLDGGPRSASCIAVTEVKLGVLSREALMTLVAQHPGAASRLLLGVARSMAERLREGNRRLRTVSQVTRALQSELDAVHAVNRRLLDIRGPGAATF
jgi:CRP/FNR family transcriptional regulator, cyclic AMP receptor protein